ncbi:hypothetical protein [Parachlamydia sp. AcF125]|uniref:hypothetical protein n=1 Tax=Parachlamydia sp. AcF125 TaxID=2795736 RepID=UPI001BC9630A|nr:hypothetical protein [Parachlamydia sp. AcF125]MBS4168425.1 hypothetical protein [Parachlamydia sp. AcF125]
MGVSTLKLDSKVPLTDLIEKANQTLTDNPTWTVSTRLNVRKPGNCFIEWLRYIFCFDSTSSWGYKKTAAKLHALIENNPVQIPHAGHSWNSQFKREMGNILTRVLRITEIAEGGEIKVDPAFTKRQKRVDEIKAIYRRTMDLLDNISHSDEVKDAQDKYAEAWENVKKVEAQLRAKEEAISTLTDQISATETSIQEKREALNKLEQEKGDSPEIEGLKGEVEVLDSRLSDLQEKLINVKKEKSAADQEETNSVMERGQRYSQLISLQTKKTA